MKYICRISSEIISFQPSTCLSAVQSRYMSNVRNGDSNLAEVANPIVFCEIKVQSLHLTWSWNHVTRVTALSPRQLSNWRGRGRFCYHKLFRTCSYWTAQTPQLLLKPKWNCLNPMKYEYLILFGYRRSILILSPYYKWLTLFEIPMKIIGRGADRHMQ